MNPNNYQSKEHQEFEEELRYNRQKEQKEKSDYDYDENGMPEKCDDCGAYLNSHGHCPRCDY